MWVNEKLKKYFEVCLLQSVLSGCFDSQFTQISMFMHTWNADSPIGVPDIGISKKTECEYLKSCIVTGFMF